MNAQKPLDWCLNINSRSCYSWFIAMISHAVLCVRKVLRSHRVQVPIAPHSWKARWGARSWEAQNLKLCSECERQEKSRNLSVTPIHCTKWQCGGPTGPSNSDKGSTSIPTMVHVSGSYGTSQLWGWGAQTTNSWGTIAGNTFTAPLSALPTVKRVRGYG